MPEDWLELRDRVKDTLAETLVRPTRKVTTLDYLDPGERAVLEERFAAPRQSPPRLDAAASPAQREMAERLGRPVPDDATWLEASAAVDLAHGHAPGTQAVAWLGQLGIPAPDAWRRVATALEEQEARDAAAPPADPRRARAGPPPSATLTSPPSRSCSRRRRPSASTPPNGTDASARWWQPRRRPPLPMLRRSRSGPGRMPPPAGGILSARLCGRAGPVGPQSPAQPRRPRSPPFAAPDRARATMSPPSSPRARRACGRPGTRRRTSSDAGISWLARPPSTPTSRPNTSEGSSSRCEPIGTSTCRQAGDRNSAAGLPGRGDCLRWCDVSGDLALYWTTHT